MSIREDWPLVTFTLLFPTSIVTYTLAILLPATFDNLQSAGMATAWALAVIGLLLTPLHLGRPLRALRAFAHVTRSWLSRETALAAIYVMLLTLHAFEPLMHTGLATTTLSAATMLLGLAGLVASARSYRTLARPGWHFGRTLAQFLGTGISTALLLGLVLASDAATQGEIPPPLATIWLGWMAAGSGLWIVLLWGINLHEIRAFVARADRLPAEPTPDQVWRVYRAATVLAGVAVALVIAAIIIRHDTLLFLLALVAETSAGWFYRLSFFARGRPLSVEGLIGQERAARLGAAIGDRPGMPATPRPVD